VVLKSKSAVGKAVVPVEELAALVCGGEDRAGLARALVSGFGFNGRDASGNTL